MAHWWRPLAQVEDAAHKRSASYGTSSATPPPIREYAQEEVRETATCKRCGDTGWAEDDTIIRDGFPYQTVGKCDCGAHSRPYRGGLRTHVAADERRSSAEDAFRQIAELAGMLKDRLQ